MISASVATPPQYAIGPPMPPIMTAQKYRPYILLKLACVMAPKLIHRDIIQGGEGRRARAVTGNSIMPVMTSPESHNTPQIPAITAMMVFAFLLGWKKIHAALHISMGSADRIG